MWTSRLLYCSTMTCHPMSARELSPELRAPPPPVRLPLRKPEVARILPTWLESVTPFSDLHASRRKCSATRTRTDEPSSYTLTGSNMRVDSSRDPSMPGRNEGTELDLEWVSRSKVNTQAVLSRAQELQGKKLPRNEWQAAWLLRAVSCMDLTTLSGDDTQSNVHRLCLKALQPIRMDLLQEMDMSDKGLTTAAVCVYPSRVADAVATLKAANSSLPVASVATGFPAGQTPLEVRLQEVRLAVAGGAGEVDVVISRSLALTGQWQALYDELCQFREACGSAHLKTILAVGELGTFTNVYRASLVAMMAGSDFIKTSTGKETVNATIPVAVVMARAIRDYQRRTGYKVGFKPAGGIRTAQESLMWLVLMKEELGPDWLRPHLFRLGASSLLADIERQIYHHATGKYANYHELPMA